MRIFKIEIIILIMDLFLEGNKINLRRIRMSDSRSIQLHADESEIAHYLTLPSPYTLRDSEALVRRSNRLIRLKKAYHLGIENKKNGEIIGMIGLRSVNLKDKNAEVGYWIGKKYRKKGFTKEALNLILEFAFKNIKLVRIYAVVHARNIASYRLLEHCGFRREGTWRKASFIGKRWNDVYSYGILRREFKGG